MYGYLFIYISIGCSARVIEWLEGKFRKDILSVLDEGM